jgi:leucyl aminopeptidase (aminopeptidase T)
MRSSDVFYSAVKVSITHSQAVIDAVKSGSRGLMMSQWTEDMMISGGIEADFKSVAHICKAVSDGMAGAKELRLTTPFGTDLSMCTEGRPGNAMTCMVSKGQFTGVPNVEANVAPIEGSAEGVIVVDASIPYAGIGLLEEPVTCKVEKGYIVSIEGGRQAKDLEEILRSKNDPYVYNVGEIGVGLNPKSVFTGIMMEDEGVWGSVHIGIGTNATVGGKIRAAIHYDLILTKATMIADGRKILENGEVCAK